MEKMWRPPEWKALKDGIYAGLGGLVSTDNPFAIADFLVEAGADAMLEALFELARESPTKEFIIDGKEHHIYAKGE